MNQDHSGSGDNVGRDKNEQTTNDFSGAEFGGGVAGRDYLGDVNKNKTVNNFYNSPQNQRQRDKNQQDLIQYIGEIVDRLLAQSLRNQVYITLNKVKDDSKVTPPMQLKFAHLFSIAFLLTPILVTIALIFKSGIPVLLHFALRLVLTFNGYSPWNYARFLDYCTEQLLLQRIGGGYRFIHRLLQEHLLEFRMKN